MRCFQRTFATTLKSYSTPLGGYHMSNPITVTNNSSVAHVFNAGAAAPATTTTAATGNSSASSISSAAKTEERSFVGKIYDKVASFVSTVWNKIADAFRTVFCCKASTTDAATTPENQAKVDAKTAATIIAQFEKKTPNQADIDALVAQFAKMTTPVEVLKVLNTVCVSNFSTADIAKAFVEKMPEGELKAALQFQVFVANGSGNVFNGNVINGDFGATVLLHASRDPVVQTALSNTIAAEIAKLPTPAAKMSAYADMISNRATSNLLAFNLYAALPVDIQNGYKAEIWKSNGESNLFNGADRQNIGDYVVANEPVSDLAKRAAVSFVANLTAPAATPATTA